MAGGNQIQFGVGFNVNEAGLTKLKQSLQEIQKLTAKDLMGSGNFSSLDQAKQKLNEVKKSAAEVQNALNRAFNADLGTYNISKFNAELRNMNLGTLASQFNSLGAVGQQAFLDIERQALSVNTQFKQSYTLLTKMGQTLANTIKWNIASGAINAFTGSITNAFNYVRALDSSLTDIRIVTGQSREEMAQFALQANEAAQALGRQTKEYTNAALAYYQQGLSSEEVQARTAATLKAQNITGAGTEMADYLTAVWNGYKATNDEIELYVDKLALVADSSASNLAELATGMSKVAATANNMGVTIDQLTAQLATIIATTRQAPQTVGNALKTIYARMNDIKAGTDEADISLGNYTKKMASLGVNVLDSNGRLRDTGEVMEEIGAKWRDMTSEQQKYLAQTMAGQRQMNNLIALFDNWETYSEMLNTSLNAEGTLNEKNERYMESLTAHINKFKAAVEGLQDSAISEDSISGIIDLGTKGIQLLTSLTNSIGGMKGVLLGLGAISTHIFAEQISNGIVTMITNFNVAKQNAQQLANELATLKSFDVTTSEYMQLSDGSLKTAIQDIQQLKSSFLEYGNVITSVEEAAINQLIAQKTEIDKNVLGFEELVQKASDYANAAEKLEIKLGSDAISQVSNFIPKDILQTDIKTGTSQLLNPESIASAIDALELLKTNYEDFQGMLKDLSAYTAQEKSLKRLIDSLREQQSGLEETSQEYQDLANKIKIAQEALDDAESKLVKSGNSQEVFINAVRDAAEIENTFGERTSEVIKILDQLEAGTLSPTTAFRQLQEIFTSCNGEVDILIDQLSNLSNSVETNNDKVIQYESSWQKLIATLNNKEIGAGVAALLQGVSSLAMGIQSLVSVSKTIKQVQNEQISAGEGALRVTLSLSLALPMLTRGLSSVSFGLLKLIPSLHSATSAAVINSAADLTLANSLEILTAALRKALAAALGWIATPIGAVAVAAAIAIGVLIAAENKEAKALEKAKKEAEKAKQAYEDLKQTYEDFKSSISDYEEAQAALDTLVKGTEEWRDALAEANNIVLELLDNYPQLAKYITTGADGRLILDTKAAEQEMSTELQTAQIERFRTQANERQKQSAVDATNLWRNGNAQYLGNDILFRYAKDIPARVDEIVTTYNSLSDKIKTELELALRTNNKDKVQEIVDTYFSSLETVTANQAAAIMAGMTDEFLSYAATQKGNASYTNLLNQQMAQFYNQNANNEDYNQSKYQSSIDNFVAAMIGISDYSKESIAEIMSHLSEYTNDINKLNKLFPDIDIGTILASFFNGQVGDLSSLTGSQIEILEQNIDNYADLLKTDTATLNTAFASAKENWTDGFNVIKNTLSKGVQETFNTLTSDTKNLSIVGAKNLGAILEKTYHDSGAQGIEQLSKIFNNAGKDADTLASILSTIDWQTIDIETLTDRLDQAGVASAGLITPLEELIDLMQTAAGISFNQATEKYKNAMEVAEDLHYGDGISPEDYEKLAAYDIPGLRDMFKMNRSGEYEFYGSSKELVDQINALSFEEFRQGAADAAVELENLENILKVNADTGFEDLQESAYQAGSLFKHSTSNVELGQRQLDIINTVAPDQLGKGLTEDIQSELNQGFISKENAQILLDIMKELDITEESIKQKMTEAESIQRDWAEATKDTLHAFDEDAGSIEDIEKRAEFLKEYGGEVYNISQDLKENHEAAMLIAEDMLRAEAAAKDVEKNIDKWSKAFKNPQDNLEEYVESLQEAENDYKDLLNLDNKAHLSKDFLESADNLKLMQEAINGSTEAYDELADRAQQDLVNQGTENIFKLNADIDPEDLAQLQENLMSHINDIESSIQDIEVGAELNDAGFIAELDNLINAAGLTADQATALLASMGIDAEVIEGEPTKTQSTLNAQAYTGPTYTTESVPFGGPGFGGTFTYPKLTSEGTWEPITSSNEDESPRPFALHVVNAKKGVGSGGDINHKKLGGGGGGKGKGGGGGGNKKPKKQKPFKSKIDPYHDVNIKIGDVQEGIEKLEKERNKLIGYDATKNLREQVDLLERQKELLKEKEAIAQRELQRHKEELESMGAVFDGDVLRDGEYERLLEQKKKQVNDAIDYFNKLDADSQQTYQEYLTDLQDEYKTLEEALKDYDDTVQLMDDLNLDYQDLINQQIELSIEAFDLEINVKLDLKDAEKDFNEFRKKIIDQVKDDDYGGLAAAEADLFKTYYNVGEDGIAGGLINDLRTHSKEIAREIQIITDGGWSDVYGDDLAAATEDLKKYNDELIDALEEAQEVIDNTHEHFLDAIDAMNDAFDTQQETFDKLDDLISHDMELLQLIHGEENFDEMANLYQQQINQDTARLQALQEQQQYWQDKLDQYEEGTDEWKAAMENWQSAFEATNEVMITAVQNLQSQWENSINSIMKSLRNETFGGNMDNALEDWDKMTWHSERYLDSIERANGLLDLQNSYLDMINKTNDPKLQAKLAELEEKQLDALANKEHLREIDLKLAQQQLTVLQAQMALEDAQQAKTKMRLRRDSQGNYTYQFVADEDDIAEKTQTYLKALSDYREMANDSLHQDLEDLRDYTQEYYDALQEAQMKYGDDQQALLEEQERLYEMYFGDPDGYINALHNDAMSSMTDAQEAMFINLYGLNKNMEEDLFTKFLGPDSEVTEAAKELLGAGGEIPTLLDAFVNDSAATAFASIDEMTQETLAGDHGLLPEWSSALWNIADQYDNMFVPRVVNAMNYLQEANQAYVDGLAIMQEASNRTFSGVAEGLAYDTGYTNSLNDATQALLATQDKQLEQSEEVYQALMQNAAAFQNLTSAALDAANANYAYWLSLNGQVATSLPYSYSRASTGTVGQSDYTAAPGSGGENLNQQNSDYSHIASYASGGYTGDWDVSNGKLAVLHEKELVLNEHDTQNMLNAVNIVRTIADKVSEATNAAAATIGGNALLDLVSAAGEQILQNVIINADFPAVQDAAQIKQAFNELVNLASQKVSANRRTY